MEAEVLKTRTPSDQAIAAVSNQLAACKKAVQVIVHAEFKAVDSRQAALPLQQSSVHAQLQYVNTTPKHSHPSSNLPMIPKDWNLAAG